jgi:hypothetical protein
MLSKFISAEEMSAMDNSIHFAAPSNSHHEQKYVWRNKIMNALDRREPQFILQLCMLLSLFLAESWVLWNSPDYTDTTLGGILAAVMFIFTTETVVLSYAQKGYFLSLFFWMDVTGTLSLIIDIGWIANLFIPNGALEASQESLVRITRIAKIGKDFQLFKSDMNSRIF